MFASKIYVCSVCVQKALTQKNLPLCFGKSVCECRVVNAADGIGGFSQCIWLFHYSYVLPSLQMFPLILPQSPGLFAPVTVFAAAAAAIAVSCSFSPSPRSLSLCLSFVCVLLLRAHQHSHSFYWRSDEYAFAVLPERSEKVSLHTCVYTYSSNASPLAQYSN